MEKGRMKTIYPDFTIINTNTGKVTYWEHAGVQQVALDNSQFKKESVRGTIDVHKFGFWILKPILFFDEYIIRGRLPI